jgi:hypothetical protein
MGKRSAFERRAGDAYPTPIEAVLPLIPHLRGVRNFAEPCAGDGALVRHLESFGLCCTYAGDIATGQDALVCDSFGGVPIITNPPWRRDQLHALIGHFMRRAPFCWLLFDANWAHTRQSRDLIQHCSRILPIGRVRWIPGSPYTGKDDASWYRFEQAHEVGPLLLPFRCDNGTNQTRACEQCGTPYKVLRADTRFCSNACRQRAYRDRIAVTGSVTDDAIFNNFQITRLGGP